jgi:hypothetical protein
MIFGLGQLPITLISMLAHGHGDETCAQCSNELWPNDPTIRSLLRLFRILEVAFVVKSKLLFDKPPQNSFFAHLLRGKLHCICELHTLDKIVGTKPLPNKLLLQMDKCLKDNKNWHLLAFLSLLITRDVFEEMKLGFLVDGHTHENIDGCFGYLPKKLKKIK